MYKIMANRFAYQESHFEGGLPLEPTIHVEENVIWDDEHSIHNEESVEFPSEHDETLPDGLNETYMTAPGDNSTQYFSVLESADETILNDVGDVGLEDTIQEPEEQGTFAPGESSEVVLYRVDGSDELYGVQLGHDESGNLQKYQFKVRQTDEGTLEALSDSIQILPIDSEGINIGQAQDFNEFQESDPVENEQVFVKQEQNLDGIMPENDEFAEEEIFEDSPDVKEGILESGALIGQQQKRELFEPSTDSEFDYQTNGELEETTYYEHVEQTEMPEEQMEEEVCIPDEDLEVNGNIPMYHHQDLLQADVTQDSHEDSEEIQEHYEQLFVKESHIVEENGSTKVDENNLMAANVDTFLNDADDENESEDYETVEGTHVTGDTEEDLSENSIRRTISFQRNTGKRKVIRNIIRQIKVKLPDRDNPGHFFYVVRDPEKENLVKYPGNHTLPAVHRNPRSILKTSLPPIAPKPTSVEDLDKYDKRFAKSKEAQQARQFHNYIAQTKIIHAPVRQERLPRKQTIKPMERTDQEIVVQEVVVSSNGYIETSEGGVLKERGLLKPTEFIQLSDTDDEFDGKGLKRKRRTNRRKSSMIEITISDSDDDEVNPSLKSTEGDNASEEEEDFFEQTEPSPKRPRGRPPKITSEKTETEVNKRQRGRPPKIPTKPEESEESEEDDSEPEEEIIVIRIDNKCPKCPKSFPSEGSLRSHMQYHTYSSEMKYICEKCGEQFKNSILLKRHANAHLTKDFFCGICKKVFSDQSQLIAHRRTHVKQQMFRVTNMPKDSPKRPKKTSNLICNDCGKSFSSALALGAHARVHKKFACATCAATFLSKLTLDNHVRKNCVKSPMRRASSVKGIDVPKTGETKVKCDSCPMTFNTYTSLFKHKVSKHGLETPNKNVLTKSAKIVRQRMYSGVPANDRLRKAYLGLRSKLAENN